MGYHGYQRIRITAADGICRATIDNPPINLLDVHLILELSRFGTEVAADEDIRVVIVDSADPDFFVAHTDITLIQRLPTDDITLHDELSPFHAMVELVRTMPKATIASSMASPRPSAPSTPRSVTPRRVCGSRTNCSVKRSPGRPPHNACRHSWTLVARPAR